MLRTKTIFTEKKEILNAVCFGFVLIRGVARYGHHIVATVLKKLNPQNQIINNEDIFDQINIIVLPIQLDKQKKLLIKCSQFVPINCRRRNIWKKWLMWCFQFLNYFQFFNHIWKKEYFFPRIQFLHVFPLPQLMATNLKHLIKSFDCVNFLYRQDNCMYLVNKYYQYWFMTDTVTFLEKYLFMKISLHKLY